MTYTVTQISTGNVGKQALAGTLDNPALGLVAAPGILTALELPLITGKGLVAGTCCAGA